MKARLVLLLMLGSVIVSSKGQAATITTYPVGTILENIAVAPDGNLFVTDVGSGTIFRFRRADRALSSRLCRVQPPVLP